MDILKGQIALFIDADNAPSKKIDFILSELANYGIVNIRRAYGNWTNSRLDGWASMLHEHAIQPIQQFDLVKGKNATDMAMTIDCMDVMYSKKVDTFCIVSSDCDFTPLVTRLLSEGKSVIGFGERKAASPFVNACSRFLFLDQSINDGLSSVPIIRRDSELRRDTKLVSLFRNAIESRCDDDGWAPLMDVTRHINNHTSFDVKNYGFKKVVDLVKAIGLFEVKTVKGSQVIISDKRKQ
ncbi:NYN domain-containing protein [Aliivibrio fischeri]|uniref:NYN domain-containing protein n=1 Tax=Aliivibrio fischeri TaxID=668 RepID=UPI0007C4D0E8|nr:NYN domain-containing protein [Aliivibrio fischeri]TGA68225.1 NYN domain-containing protein [Aliivibrio fischeri]